MISKNSSLSGPSPEGARQTEWVSWSVFGIAIIVALFILSRTNFLLFHILAEVFSIVVACAIFIIVWNTRHISENNSLIFIGIAYFFVSFIDILHTVSYKGMNVFGEEWGANLPTQLWIMGRYLQTVSLLIFPIIIDKKIRLDIIFIGYFFFTAFLLCSVFVWHVFPDCYIEGEGLTPFKVISEYIFCILLGISLFLLFRKRLLIDPNVFNFFVLSILFTIGAELAFTFYISVYGLSNVVGHVFKILSFFFIYLALIRSCLTQPFNILFKSLKESEKKYQNIFTNARVGLFRVKRSDKKTVEVNEYFSSLLGYPDIESCLSELGNSGNRQAALLNNELDAALSKTASVKNLELAIRKKDNSTVWISMSGSLSADHEHMEGALVDISKRKRQEIAQAVQLKLINLTEDYDVRDLLQKFLDEAELLTDSKIGFFHFVEPDQEIISLQTWSSNTLTSICTTDPEAVHYPVSQAGVWAEPVLTQRPVVHNDYRLLENKKGLPDGHAPVSRELVVPVIRSEKVVAILGVGNKETPYLEEDVKTVHSVAESAWEVIERKRAENRLKKAYAEMEQKVIERTLKFETIAHEFESLFNASQVGMMVLKDDRIFHKGNQRLADILGYRSPEEMKGLSMKALHLNEERFHEFGDKHYNPLVTGEVLQVEYELKKKDGSTLWCSLSGKALDINQPSDLDKGVLWIIDDISSQKDDEFRLKKTLEELENSNTELSRFAYVSSHDLQEPLRAIVGFLQLLESRYIDKLDEKGKHYIKRSVSAGHRMQTLINDLLTLSRVDTRGKTHEPADFNEIVEKVKKHLSTHIREKGAGIKCDTLPILTVDESQIVTVFTNLVSNAIKYNESDSPEIEIGLTDAYDAPCFYVKDNGIGISEQFYDRIFIVFQRLHGRDEYSGTGIGLTLCKKIVERHGGKIWVDSNQGEGSTFFFTLPKERIVK